MHRIRCFRWPVVLVLVAIGVMLASAAMADDFQAPPNGFANWNRANPLAATFEWDFNTYNLAGIAPDGAIPATPADGGGGGPLAIPGPNIDGSVGGQWTGGASAPNSQITFLLPNWIDDQAWKDVWAQITFTDGGLGSPSLDFIDAYDPSGPVANVFNFALEDATTHHRVESWQLIPNPDWEVFVLNVPQGTVIDQVIFDTVSRGGSTIPEPGTYVLFGLGALMMLGWNRRRKKAA